MKIRNIKIDDFEELYKLWQKVDLELYPIEREKQRFKSIVSLNPDLCLKLVDKNKIIGSIMGSFDGANASLNRLAIHPQYQRKGYGTKHIKILENKLKRKKIKKIITRIHISNREVITFYKKLDYKNMDYVVTLYKEL